jgi:hypothetical protein
MLSLGMTLSFLFLPLPIQAQTSPLAEYHAKAHFLSKFPIFVGMARECIADCTRALSDLRLRRFFLWNLTGRKNAWHSHP